MLAPSGGGLILYQAYGNLYAMTGRKVHLLEDKQIPSVGVFDENRFSSIPRPSQGSLKNRTDDDIGVLEVADKVSDEVVVQQPELRKSKTVRTPKSFGPEFQLYLIEGIRNEVFDQHSYCFNVENDPKTFDEAIKSHYVAFWKDAINDEMDFIMGNNTLVLVDLPSCCNPLGRKWIFKIILKVDGTIENFKARLIIHQMDVKTTFLKGELDEEVYMNQTQGFIVPGNETKVDLTKESLSSRFFMKDMGEADVILVSTPMDTSEKLRTNNGQAVSQLEYYRISNTEENSSTSGWVFQRGGGAISWASKKKTCITSSIIESEFMALVVAGKEAKWLKNMILETSLWSKPIAPISI
ncbi:zinc finger, CCHC-type containing protein [Tanacetum coccineum]